jgi:hypothetical protein
MGEFASFQKPHAVDITHNNAAIEITANLSPLVYSVMVAMAHPR